MASCCVSGQCLTQFGTSLGAKLAVVVSFLKFHFELHVFA